jgi:hypothetical protein
MKVAALHSQVKITKANQIRLNGMSIRQPINRADSTLLLLAVAIVTGVVALVSAPLAFIVATLYSKQMRMSVARASVLYLLPLIVLISRVAMQGWAAALWKP